MGNVGVVVLCSSFSCPLPIAMGWKDNSSHLLSLVSVVLLLLLQLQRSLQHSTVAAMDEDEVAENMSDSLCFQLQPMEVDNVTEAVMQQWHLWSDMSFLDEDLGFWIKP